MEKRNTATEDYTERMKKIVDKIKVGQYVKQLTGGFDALSINPVVPCIRCYRIVGIQNDCYKEKRCSYQYKALILEYIGNNIKLPEKACIYYMDELLPFCQFKITKTE